MVVRKKAEEKSYAHIGNVSYKKTRIDHAAMESQFDKGT